MLFVLLGLEWEIGTEQGMQEMQKWSQLKAIVT